MLPAVWAEADIIDLADQDGLPGLIDAAELLSLSSEIGTIEPGKAADIVAVAGDPNQDITQLEDVDFVMKGGAVARP